MFEIGKTFKFEAAHFLPCADTVGCRTIHGHSYRVEVVVGIDSGTALANGVVLDFCHLSAWWREKVNLDHTLICQKGDPRGMILKGSQWEVVFMDNAPTAENMALLFHQSLTEWLAAYGHSGRGVTVRRVRVWETENAWAEYAP